MRSVCELQRPMFDKGGDGDMEPGVSRRLRSLGLASAEREMQH